MKVFHILCIYLKMCPKTLNNVIHYNICNIPKNAPLYSSSSQNLIRIQCSWRWWSRRIWIKEFWQSFNIEFFRAFNVIIPSMKSLLTKWTKTLLIAPFLYTIHTEAMHTPSKDRMFWFFNGAKTDRTHMIRSFSPKSSSFLFSSIITIRCTQRVFVMVHFIHSPTLSCLGLCR